MNKTCTWTGDTTFRVDPQNANHQAHLIADAQLAEELAIRYADAEFNRLYGYEAHGGAVENGRVRNECMARLVAAIETNHAVTAEQVAVARGRRNRTFDTFAALLFVPVYALLAAIACRVLRRRFESERRSVQFVATVLASIVAAIAALQLGQLWLSVWEVVRVGNGHMSMFRTATRTAWTHD
ncbi:MAG TPA: hypothetical protein VE714_04330, partial [Gemmatimonadales bacterium]|nr:hypothetical protein [Gemmatimonadales bacterium]